MYDSEWDAHHTPQHLEKHHPTWGEVNIDIIPQVLSEYIFKMIWIISLAKC